MTPTGPPPAIRMGREEGECMELSSIGLRRRRDFTFAPSVIAHACYKGHAARRPPMTLARRQLLQFAAAAPLLALQPKRASAEAYPTRPVRVIVTTGPGGQGDTT